MTSKISTEAQRIEEFFARRESRSADAWIPSEGDWFIGTVTEIDTRTSDYGDYERYVYKIIKSSSGHEPGKLLAVHVFHQLLKERLSDLDTQVGSTQIVSYVGHRTKRNPTPEQISQGRDKYHDYYVENWSTTTPAA